MRYLFVLSNQHFAQPYNIWIKISAKKWNKLLLAKMIDTVANDCCMIMNGAMLNHGVLYSKNIKWYWLASIKALKAILQNVDGKKTESLIKLPKSVINWRSCLYFLALENKWCLFVYVKLFICYFITLIVHMYISSISFILTRFG